MPRTGTAHLPLHHGRVPPWLAGRMERLARVIVEAIVLEHGRDELLARLAHPFWFQSFGAVMGMDWHSSGITTSVIAALQRGLAPVSDELGLWVCGGRGARSRETPGQILAIAERTGLPGDDLARSSRLVAKIDSAAVQDGFELYLHGFVLDANGGWVVVQQGMNGDRKLARRYHWHGASVDDFFGSPHSGIEGPTLGQPIVNLADTRAAASRGAQLSLLAERAPDRLVAEVARLEGRGERAQRALPHLDLPAHHQVAGGDVRLARLHASIAAAKSRGPEDFAELVLVPGVGARTVRALALVAEVVHGAPSRFDDPARFAMAHGGKDGHPFPVPLRVYDHTLSVLRAAVTAAKLGQDDKLAALRRLDQESRRLEGRASGPSLERLLTEERASAPQHGGRTVFDPPAADRRPARAKEARPRRGEQLSLLPRGEIVRTPR